MIFDFDPNYNLHITIDPAMKLQLLSEFSKVYNKYEPMQQWFDDPNVPQKDKEQYSYMLTNALRELSFIWNLLRYCGVPEQEIKEFTKIPF